jgi:hypothetical protein
MTEIELGPDRTKFLVRVFVDGVLSFADRFDAMSAKAREAQAARLGVAPASFLLWIEEARREGHAKRFPLPLPDRGDKAGARVRRIEEAAAAAVTHDLDSRFVKDVLPTVPVTHVAEWDSLEDLCCLDVDYHEGTPPPRDWLSNVVWTKLTPRPCLWHFSRGGGLHLFYARTDLFTAEELASVAALRFRSIDQSAGLELKRVVRGPGAEECHALLPQDEGAGFVEWLGSAEFDADARDAWLDSEGMECGKRYDHDKCPICPSADEGKHRQPVVVSEAGIYCFKCEGLGLSIGRRKAGWASWAAILGSPSSGDLGVMVRRITHWGHAKWVLTEKYCLPEALSRTAYKAALKSYHRDDAAALLLVNNAFGEIGNEMARVNDLWYNIESSHVYPKDIQQMLATLPACQFVDADGKQKVSMATVTQMTQTMDLTAKGYPNVEVIHGFKLAAQFLGDLGKRAMVAVPNPKLVEKGRRYCPRYVPKTKRMPLAEARATIESVFPKLDWTLVELAICSFACAQETRAGLLPMFFVSGPAGAAKTSTPRIAAAIYGATTYDVVYDPDPAHLRQSIYLGGVEAPCVLLNEILKDSARGRNKLSAREALDFTLNLTENSSSWVSYRGPVKMGRLPAIIMTEPVCPLALKDETQLARRIRHHRVYGRKDEWKRTVSAVKLSDFHLLRAVSDAINRACDSVLSDVCDKWFSLPMTWDQIADELGVRTIEDSPDFDDTSEYLAEFYRLVCEAPDLTGRLADRYNHYKRISRADGATSILAEVYTMFADGGGEQWVTSRRLLEKDWSAVLKTELPVSIDMTTDGVNVYVRFRSGPPKAPGTLFNGDIR